VLYAPGITDIETVRKICSAVSKPVNVLAIPGFTMAGLADAGASRISVGSKLATYAFAMIQKASREMLDQGTFEFSRDCMPFGTLQHMFSSDIA
jgi:2-methylisocitrate lyase-like PEP mutase family enzyme